MKIYLIILCCLLFFYTGKAQKVLAIDVYKPWHFKRFHINQNEVITYKLNGSAGTFRHTLVDMEDSSLYIETGERIYLNEIKQIIIDRSNFLTRKVANFFTVAGIGFILIDTFNHAINDESPILKEQTVLIGGSLFVVGELFHLANKKRIRPGKNKTLKILDLSPTQ